MRTPHHSVKQTDSLVPLVPALYVQNSLDNAEACLPLTQGCQPLQLDITIALVCTVLASGHAAFLASVQQGRALECGFVALNSTGTHCHAYRKYPGRLRNTDSLYNPDTQWWSHDARNRGVAL